MGEVFLVDDDEGHCVLAEHSLQEAGILNPVVRFSNGYDVLDAIFQSPDQVRRPMLMLLDINMPGMRGTEVLEKVRADPRTSSIPVVMLTTSRNAQEVEKCYQEGCNLYLVKPIDYSEFANSIRQLGLVLQIAELPQSETWGGLVGADANWSI